MKEFLFPTMKDWKTEFPQRHITIRFGFCLLRNLVLQWHLISLPVQLSNSSSNQQLPPSRRCVQIGSVAMAVFPPGGCSVNPRIWFPHPLRYHCGMGLAFAGQGRRSAPTALEEQWWRVSRCCIPAVIDSLFLSPGTQFFRNKGRTLLNCKWVLLQAHWGNMFFPHIAHTLFPPSYGASHFLELSGGP